MELRHLRYFVMVAEELHFGKAAERLDMAQPPLSRQIQDLERELGVALFVRNNRRVELTESGRVFLSEARQTLAQAERATRAARRAQQGEIGHLTVGYTADAALDRRFAEALRLFQEAYPESELRLQELHALALPAALQAHTINAGFLRAPVTLPGMIIETLPTEPFLVAHAYAHKLTQRGTIPLRLLAQERFLIPDRSQALHAQVLNVCAESGFMPERMQEVEQIQTAVYLTVAGAGIAIVPESLRSLNPEGLAYKPIEDSTLRTGIAVAWHPRHTSVLLSHFLEVVRDRVGQTA